MSSHLQEVITYVGSDYVFEEASHLLDKLLGVDVYAKQIQKVSQYFGLLLEEEAQQQDESSVATPLEATQDVYTYVQCDGSMLLTREENRTADAVERDQARAYFSDSYSRSVYQEASKNPAF